MNPRDELRELQQLVDIIMRGLQEILMSGEILSEDFQRVVAEELNITADRIEELQRIIAGGADVILPPPLPPPGIESSNVNSFAYDPESQKLWVKFHGKDEKDAGPTYSYEGVPAVIFDLFRKGSVPCRSDGKNKWGEWWKGKVPSLGASLYTLLRLGGFPYQRLS